MKSEKEKKESARPSLKKEGRGHQQVHAVRIQPASAVEARKIERAVDRLLTEMVRRVRARERNSS